MTPQSCCLVFTQRHWKRGCCLVAQSSPILCDPVDCSPPGSSVHGILQAIIPEWVAISFSRGSSQPRGWTWVSCTGRWILYCWDTREACWKPQFSSVQSLSCVRLFVNLWTVACQAPLSMGFPRQQYQSGLPFPSPGDLPDLGTEAVFPVSLALASSFLYKITKPKYINSSCNSIKKTK